MPDLEDIVQRVALTGHDDVIESFGEIGKAGVDALERIAASAEHSGSSFAGLIEGVAGVAAAFAALQGTAFLWAEKSSGAVHSLEILAQEAGESAEEISGLENAIASLGGSADGLQTAFRRMGNTITRTWEQVKKDIASSTDTMIQDSLKVEKAEQALFRARDARDKAMGGAGRSPAELQAEKQKEATTSLQEAEESLHLAYKKQQEDRLNAPQRYIKAVEDVVKGEKTAAEASKTANLNIQNIVKGLIANTEGASDALEHFNGNLNSIVGEGPKVQEVFFNLADYIKNSGNAAQNSALLMRLMGRTMGAEMLPVLSQGGDAIKKQVAQMKEWGLVIDEEGVKKGTAFHQAYNALSSAIGTTTTKLGLFLAPIYTDRMKDFTRYIGENQPALMKWGETMATKVKPYIDTFFDSLKGLGAAMTGEQLGPEDAGAERWQKRFEAIGKGLTAVKDFVVGTVQEIKKEFNSIFGTDLTTGEVAAGAFIAFKTLGGTLGGAFKLAFLAAAGISWWELFKGGKLEKGGAEEGAKAGKAQKQSLLEQFSPVAPAQAEPAEASQAGDETGGRGGGGGTDFGTIAGAAASLGGLWAGGKLIKGARSLITAAGARAPTLLKNFILRGSAFKGLVFGALLEGLQQIKQSKAELEIRRVLKEDYGLDDKAVEEFMALPDEERLKAVDELKTTGAFVPRPEVPTREKLPPAAAAEKKAADQKADTKQKLDLDAEERRRRLESHGVRGVPGAFDSEENRRLLREREAIGGPGVRFVEPGTGDPFSEAFGKLKSGKKLDEGDIRTLEKRGIVVPPKTVEIPPLPPPRPPEAPAAAAPSAAAPPAVAPIVVAPLIVAPTKPLVEERPEEVEPSPAPGIGTRRTGRPTLKMLREALEPAQELIGPVAPPKERFSIEELLRDAPPPITNRPPLPSLTPLDEQFPESLKKMSLEVDNATTALSRLTTRVSALQPKSEEQAPKTAEYKPPEKPRAEPPEVKPTGPKVVVIPAVQQPTKPTEPPPSPEGPKLVRVGEDSTTIIKREPPKPKKEYQPDQEPDQPEPDQPDKREPSPPRKKRGEGQPDPRNLPPGFYWDPNQKRYVPREQITPKFRDVRYEDEEPEEEATYAAGGGAVSGFGSGTSDNVPIMASVGEFVVKADGSNLDAAIRHFVGYQRGGEVRRDAGEESERRERERREKERRRRLEARLQQIAARAEQQQKGGTAAGTEVTRITTSGSLGYSKQRAAAQRALRKQERYEEERGIGGAGGGPDDPYSPQPPGYSTGEPYVHGGIVRGFASGGLIGALSGGAGVSGYAGGGPVLSSIMSGLTQQFSRIAGGGEFAELLANSASTNALVDQVTAQFGSQLTGPLGYHQLDLRTDALNFPVMIGATTMEQLQGSALAAKLTQTGQRPSWYS